MQDVGTGAPYITQAVALVHDTSLPPQPVGLSLVYVTLRLKGGAVARTSSSQVLMDARHAERRDIIESATAGMQRQPNRKKKHIYPDSTNEAPANAIDYR